MKKQYPLKPFTEESNFKSYDELKKRMQDVIGDDIRFTQVTNATIEDVASTQDDTATDTETSEETDALNYFERLAKE